jgi:hypothetical protein
MRARLQTNLASLPMRLLSAALALVLLAPAALAQRAPTSPAAALPSDVGAHRLAVLRSHYAAQARPAPETSVVIAEAPREVQRADVQVEGAEGPTRTGVGAAVGWTVGLGAGAVTGGAVGAVARPDGKVVPEGLIPGVLIGAVVGASSGGAVGAHLGNRRRGHLLSTLGTALLPIGIAAALGGGMTLTGGDNAGAVVLAVGLAASPLVAVSAERSGVGRE